MLDDIIYLCCLLSSVGLGKHYRKIQDEEVKKVLGTCFGLTIVIIVSGVHAIHCLASFLMCALVVVTVHPSKCHLVSFGVMFGYLLFFRMTNFFGLPNVPGPTNMIQMILTMKMAGIAFEKNVSCAKIEQFEKQEQCAARKKAKADKLKAAAEKKAMNASTREELGFPLNELETFEYEPESSGNESEDSENESEDSEIESEAAKKDEEKAIDVTDYDFALKNISILEMFHYSFNFIGVLTGPYYRYRTFRDYFDTPFKHYIDCRSETISKLKCIGLYCVIHLIVGHIWPISYATQPEFYEEKSWLYRLFYLWPAFIIFRTRIYAGLMLGECVCTNAGFGAYPDRADATNGEGPRKQYLEYKAHPERNSFNFKTIENIYVYNVETCASFRSCLKEWNICIQHWLAVNVHKRFPSKKYRLTATLLVSSFWHGIHPGHYLCLMGAPFYLPVEDMYVELFLKEATGIRRTVLNTLFCISKMFVLGYLGMAFYILTFDKICFYYTSVYHFGYIYYLVLAVIGMALMRQKKAEEKLKQKKRGETKGRKRRETKGRKREETKEKKSQETKKKKRGETKGGVKSCLM